MGAGCLTLAAVLLGGASAVAAGPSGAAGWLQYSRWYYVAYLGVFPGILGHLSFNLLLKYMHPLAIALSCALEPVSGLCLAKFQALRESFHAFIAVLCPRWGIAVPLSPPCLVRSGFEV